MILSHSKKFIFIHIYKVAGVSVKRALQPYQDMRFSDFSFPEGLKFLLAEKFAFLSKWSVSHIKSKELKQHLKGDYFDRYFKFCFVRNPWDWQVSLFHYMLQYKDHPQHQLISNMKSFDEYIEWRIENDFELQSDFIYDDSGKLLVDFIGRFENLEGDFQEICSRLGLPTIALPKANISHHAYYKSYYTPHTCDLIYKAYKKDIELLKYDF